MFVVGTDEAAPDVGSEKEEAKDACARDRLKLYREEDGKRS